jgi:uncharacterized protein (TIGR03435 family)
MTAHTSPSLSCPSRLLDAALIVLAAPVTLAQTGTVPSSAGSDACSTQPSAVVDVISVKPSQIGYDRSIDNGTADSVASSGTVKSLIESAYGLHDFQVSGGPDWTSSATWDIVAKVDQPDPNWSKLSKDEKRTQRNRRLQAVLVQRFALQCHIATKELPVYNLVLAKGGSKLKQTSPDALRKSSLNWEGEGSKNRMEGTDIEIRGLAAELSRALGCTVIDKTGLLGLYDLHLIWSSGSSAAAQPTDADAASGPSIFTAVQEQLGLRLESAKGPVPVLVIDHIEKPTEN